MTNRHPLRAIRLSVVVVCLALVLPTTARPACNLIPQAQPAFRGALGTVDRPYAAPGDFVDVYARQVFCDGTSPGIGLSSSQNEITLLFTPTAGPKSAVVITTDACANLADRLDA